MAPPTVNGASGWDMVTASWTRTRTSTLHTLPGAATPRQQPHTPQHLVLSPSHHYSAVDHFVGKEISGSSELSVGDRVLVGGCG